MSMKSNSFRTIPSIDTAQCGPDRLGYSLHGKNLGVERQIRRDDRHVFQRENVLRRDEDSAAAHLDRVLGGADHGGADPFVGRLDSRSPSFDPRKDRSGERPAEIAEGPVFAAVDILRNAARKADHVRRAPVAQRVEPQQGRSAGVGSVLADGLEQTVGHALDHRVQALRVGFPAHFEDEADLGGESPALTETNLPAWEANSSPIARALLRRTATPVRIRAPVSIVSGSTPASSYCLSMKRPSACASMVASPAYGVRRTSDSWTTLRSDTT